MNEKIVEFLETLTPEEVDAIPAIISDRKKAAKQADLDTKISAAISMYNELNILGNRIYTIVECAKHNKVGKVALSKAINSVKDTPSLVQE